MRKKFGGRNNDGSSKTVGSNKSLFFEENITEEDKERCVGMLEVSNGN